MTLIALTLALACADMQTLQIPGASVSITKAEKPADNLPPRCRVDGVIDQRTGIDTKGSTREYAIGFALVLPDNWNASHRLPENLPRSTTAAAPIPFARTMSAVPPVGVRA
jgi:hypothetical protein